MPRGDQNRHRAMRADEKAQWRAVNAACSICGQATIDWDAPANTPNAFEVDHVHPVKTNPDREFDPTNRAPSHHRCNRGKGAAPARPGIGVTSEPW